MSLAFVTRFGLFSLLASGIFAGADAHADEILTRMQAPRLERIVKSFSDVTEFKEVGTDRYTFRVDGTRLVLINKGTTMQIAAGWTTEGVSLSTINSWNRDKRFAKAYLDKDDDPWLESDIELNGGVTESNVKEWLKTYVALMKMFKKHLRE